MDSPNSGFYIDKKIPLTLIFAIIVQLVVLVWGASSLSSAVNANRVEINRLEGAVSGEGNYLLRDITKKLKLYEEEITKMKKQHSIEINTLTRIQNDIEYKLKITQQENAEYRKEQRRLINELIDKKRK